MPGSNSRRGSICLTQANSNPDCPRTSQSTNEQGRLDRRAAAIGGEGGVRDLTSFRFRSPRLSSFKIKTFSVGAHQPQLNLHPLPCFLPSFLPSNLSSLPMQPYYSDVFNLLEDLFSSEDFTDFSSLPSSSPLPQNTPDLSGVPEESVTPEADAKTLEDCLAPVQSPLWKQVSTLFRPTTKSTTLLSASSPCLPL